MCYNLEVIVIKKMFFNLFVVLLFLVSCGKNSGLTEKVDISFYNKNILIEIKSINKNERLSLLDAPIIEGYKCYGYYKDSEFAEEIDENTMIYQNMDIYCKYYYENYTILWYGFLSYDVEKVEYNDRFVSGEDAGRDVNFSCYSDHLDFEYSAQTLKKTETLSSDFEIPPFREIFIDGEGFAMHEEEINGKIYTYSGEITCNYKFVLINNDDNELCFRMIYNDDFFVMTFSYDDKDYCVLNDKEIIYEYNELIFFDKEVEINDDVLKDADSQIIFIDMWGGKLKESHYAVSLQFNNPRYSWYMNAGMSLSEIFFLDDYDDFPLYVDVHNKNNDVEFDMQFFEEQDVEVYLVEKNIKSISGFRTTHGFSVSEYYFEVVVKESKIEEYTVYQGDSKYVKTIWHDYIEYTTANQKYYVLKKDDLYTVYDYSTIEEKITKYTIFDQELIDSIVCGRDSIFCRSIKR